MNGLVLLEFLVSNNVAIPGKEGQLQYSTANMDASVPRLFQDLQPSQLYESVGR